MKPSWLDLVSSGFLLAALTAAVVQHYPPGAPWALAFLGYVAARAASDAFAEWRSEKGRQRYWLQTESQAMTKDSEALQKALEDAKALNAATLQALASLEAEVRTIQSQASFGAGFGVAPAGFGVGPTFGPTRGGT